MIRHILLILILGAGLSAAPKVDIKKLESELHTLDDKQWSVINKINKKVSNPRYRLLVLAMAWQESSFGKFKVLKDPRGDDYSSWGIWHISGQRLKELKPNLDPASRKLLALVSIDFQLEGLKSSLKYWRRWRLKKGDEDAIATYNAIGCYNAGYNMKAGSKYREEVTAKMVALKRFFGGYLISRK